MGWLLLLAFVVGAEIGSLRWGVDSRDGLDWSTCGCSRPQDFVRWTFPPTS